MTASSPGPIGKLFPLPGICHTTVTTGAKSGKTVSPVTGSYSTQLFTAVLLYGDRVPKQRLSRYSVSVSLLWMMTYWSLW